ncbi:MAG: hypothetical protein R3D85_07770 [Paracoccaceae bacterium]
MKFHHLIIVAALFLSVLVAGARALPGVDAAAEGRVEDLADPAFWLVLGRELIGASESSCS